MPLPRGLYLLVLTLACSSRPAPLLTTSSYFGPDSFPYGRCFGKALWQVGEPSLRHTEAVSFRLTHMGEPCSPSQVWRLEATASDTSLTYLEAVGALDRYGRHHSWRATRRSIDHHRWTQWLELRKAWGAFGAVAMNMEPLLGGDWYLAEWHDSSGYHWGGTNSPDISYDQAQSWLTFLVSDTL